MFQIVHEGLSLFKDCQFNRPRRHDRYVIAYVASNSFPVFSIHSLYRFHHNFLRAFCILIFLHAIIFGSVGFSSVLGWTFDLGKAILLPEAMINQMDSKDFQLLAALHQDARQSYRSLGRRMSLTAPAVRERLERLQEQGILQGYGLRIDPSIFGRDQLIVVFQGEWTRRDLEKVLASPDVAFAAWRLDGGLIAAVWSTESGRSIRRLADALGAKPSTGAFTERRHDLPPLSVLDLQIIDAVIDDPKIPLKKIIELTGLSPKTIRKRLEALFELSVISILPLLGPKTGSGEVVYYLAVIGDVEMKELHRLFGDAILVNKTQKPPMKYLLCCESDLGSLTAKIKALSKLPGVKSVTTTLNQELQFATDFMHSLVREQIQKLEQLRIDKTGTIAPKTYAT
jgi:DNA-binding Lrp family transcriptional regulator